MRSSAVCSLSLALWVAAAPASAQQADQAPALTLVELMRRMATTSGVEARFRERKELALLAAPLVTHGALYFVPPDRMARFTTWPGFSALIIDGDELRFRDEEGGEELDLSGSPMARVFVDNFVVLFNGDLGRLQELYAVELASEGRSWELALTPRRSPLDRVIAAVTLRGDDGGLREMEMREVGGDRTTTVFETVDPERVFEPAELERLFSDGAPLPDGPGGP
jgi:hypothetical protein